MISFCNARAVFESRMYIRLVKFICVVIAAVAVTVSYGEEGCNLYSNERDGVRGMYRNRNTHIQQKPSACFLQLVEQLRSEYHVQIQGANTLTISPRSCYRGRYYLFIHATGVLPGTIFRLTEQGMTSDIPDMNNSNDDGCSSTILGPYHLSDDIPPRTFWLTILNGNPLVGVRIGILYPKSRQEQS